MQPTPWIDAGASDELGLGQSRLLRHEGRQYALWRTEQGELYACDNACPHEGYPLLQGYTAGCVLTCAWHNFKFDLRDGRCLVGEEDLGVYPVRERDGRLELDLTPRQGADHRARLWKSLEGALYEDRLAQAARDSVRLMQAGVAPGRIAVFAARFDGQRSPWGSSHALPVAVDVLRYFAREEDEPLSALLPVLELAAESGHLRAPHEKIAPHAVSNAPEDLRAELLEAIEGERPEHAEAVFRAAVEAKIPWSSLHAWLLEACCTHFLDFGHQLIYLDKVEALRGHAEPEDYLEILVGLLRDIVHGTREDTLPPMQATQRALQEDRGQFEAWMRRQSSTGEWPPDERTAFRNTVLDARVSAVPLAVAAALREGIDRHAIAKELVIAAAQRVLRFDPAIELDPGVRENWLHVTHTLTFASAVRSVLARSDAPSTLALLFHAAHFIRHKKPLDRDEESANGNRPAPPAPAEGENGADAITDAVLRGDREEALQHLDAYLERHGLDERLRRSVEDLALRHGAVRPIRTAHVLKTLVVGLEESRRLEGDPHAALPLAAALAFAAAPMDERGAARIAREALEFVREGRPPRRLTP